MLHKEKCTRKKEVDEDEYGEIFREWRWFKGKNDIIYLRKSIRKRKENQEEQEEMHSNTILGIEKILENVESYNDEENKEDNIESKEKYKKLEEVKIVKESNRYRIGIVRKDIKKALWMLENESFYKVIEIQLGSEWIENVRNTLKIELSN